MVKCDFNYEAFVYKVGLVKYNTNLTEFSDENIQGVSDLFSSVNHVAIVVSDIGTSLSFYTDVVGFQQVMRPNFDR